MRHSGWAREEAEPLLESFVGPVRTTPFTYGWVAIAKEYTRARRQGALGRRIWPTQA